MATWLPTPRVNYLKMPTVAIFQSCYSIFKNGHRLPTSRVYYLKMSTVANFQVVIFKNGHPVANFQS
jgi:hypothetical protein